MDLPFDKPLPFHEAIDAHAVKTLLPSTGDSAALRALAPEVKRRAMMSATVDSAGRLQRLFDGTGALIRGESNLATQRLGIKQLLSAEGYAPDEEDKGTMKDLSSDRRINLQLRTNLQTAFGFGHYTAGQDPDRLQLYPAQELYRAIDPETVERGFRETSQGIVADPGQSWPDRWVKAGGQFYGDRMIAAKDDDVWDNLGSTDLFPDGLDNPYPPFAFNSGMRVRNISRAEALDLGVIEPDSPPPKPDPLSLSADLEAAPVLRAQWIRDAILESGLGHFVDGVLHFLTA